MNTLSVVKMTANRILLIHKEPNIREIVQACLTDLGGWNVRSVSSTLEGLRQASLDRPDAIILEFCLNEIDGLLFVKHLKKQPETERIPVVLLALRSKWVDFQQIWFQRYQLQVVILNPIDPLMLTVQIANALGWKINCEIDRKDNLYC